MKATEIEEQRIVDYFESQLDDETVVHVEKVTSERVAGQMHDVWNVNTDKHRWWAVDNPLNLYTQDDFKSADVVLTFHVGLMMRVASREDVPVAKSNTDFLADSWRQWEQAAEEMLRAEESEDFQAVGVRLRESLSSLLTALSDPSLLPEDIEVPKGASTEWFEHLANTFASGKRHESLRKYLKSLSDSTWQYVSWLTHSKNAQWRDAEIGVAATSHLLSVLTAAWMRWRSEGHNRCELCRSYQVQNGVCEKCAWVDDKYEARVQVQGSRSQEKMDEALKSPCIPSSDIATFIGPGDKRRR